MSKKGFTLIELLVVIAIIGILASIVLVSFPGATKRAKDSRVMSAIAQARTEMTSFHANQGTYVGFEPSASIKTELINNTYDAKSIATSTNGSTAMCMYVALREKDGTTWYCADSAGIAGKTSTNPATADCKPATAYACPAGTKI